jgi:hypothetical protein
MNSDPERCDGQKSTLLSQHALDILRRSEWKREHIAINEEVDHASGAKS